MKDKSIQKKDYDIEEVFKLLLLNPLLDLGKSERRCFRERLFKHKKENEK